MAKDGQHVTPRGDKWASQRAGASRASSLHDSQAQAIAASRGYLGNRGGGELNIHGRDGARRTPSSRATTRAAPRASRR
ncbi:DUF2188 domain-containing protein [Microbacterium oxydans]|uniref:DUF2188 domain-containing protein n=1 Tax=Microbacterium oxydans TaxID=82380 RepID=UPI001E36C76E